MINKLIQVIAQEAQVFEEFLQLLDRQKEALVDNDTDLLNDVTAQQQKKLLESQTLNRSRETLIAEIKVTNAIEGDVTVTRLLEYADEDQSHRLGHLQEAIRELDDRVAEARNTNVMLLNRSREFISRSMTAFSQVSGPDKPYTSTGAVPAEAAAVVVDRRV
jgi:flagellar biosynthesis/type III secretory pathway chaperone